MSILATVGNETLGPRGFTGNEFVQTIFLVCERDWIIASYQECD